VERRNRAWTRRAFGKSRGLIVPAFLALAVLSPASLCAKPVSVGQAKKAVRGWLKVSPRPLGAPLGKEIGTVDTFAGSDGQALYYIVYLEPFGFVIVPADDLVEPITGFVPTGVYDPSPDNPLGALVSGDMPTRIATARQVEAGKQRNMNAAGQRALQKACSKAQAKWGELLAYDDTVGITGLAGISDVRVPPLVTSKWSQGSECSQYCYNYYTPNHYVCGCVATAMAQLMRFHQHPAEGIGVHSFTITVDGHTQSASTCGGDGAGGPYNWSYMVLDPRCDNYTEQRWEAIGALCYDAGVSVYMDYAGGGSGASLSDTRHALAGTFGYSNVIRGYKVYYSDIGPPLINMINPNLDANHPAILGIRRSGGGHAIVCDGYGYDTSTIYHHLNMGWAGASDAWYDLPDVLSYDTVDTCLYNIFTSASGEIISGRILGPEGVPISGATVMAKAGGPSSYSATSNDKGIYALAKVPSNTTFTVSASKRGWSFSSRDVVTGTSTQNTTTCGNVWQVDFEGIVSGGAVEFDQETYAVTEEISIKLLDQDLQGSGFQDVILKICGGDIETVTLSENPAGSGEFHGSISSAEAGPVLEDGTIQFSGSETVIAIYEDANDGTGSPATSQDTALIVGAPTVIYQTGFTGGLPAGWSRIDAGDSTGDTWTWTNPAKRTNPNWSGTFMIVDSEYFGWYLYGVMDEQLVAGGIDCSDYMNVTLKFTHYFRYFAGGLSEVGDVDVRVNGGDWTNVARYEGADASGQVELDLSAYADGRADVQVRWHYYNANYEFYWGIDNVEVAGTPAAGGIMGDFVPDCNVNFSDFAILGSAWRTSEGQNNWNAGCDISQPKDGGIDEQDLGVFSENWLIGAAP